MDNRVKPNKISLLFNSDKKIESVKINQCSTRKHLYKMIDKNDKNNIISLNITVWDDYVEPTKDSEELYETFVSFIIDKQESDELLLEHVRKKIEKRIITISKYGITCSLDIMEGIGEV